MAGEQPKRSASQAAASRHLLEAARDDHRLRRRWRALGAARALALVAAIAALVQAPFAFREAAEEIADLRGMSREERRLAPARAVSFPEPVLSAAARALPPDARYVVVVGGELPLPGALDEAVRPLFYHWLFPRRYVTALEEADWVIAYGARPEQLGVATRRPVELAPGVRAAEIVE